MSALPNDLEPGQAGCSLDGVPVLADPEVVNLAPFPFAITDLETGDFLFINELVCKLFKIDCNAKQSLNISSFYCDLGFRARVVEQILKEGVVRDVEVPLKRTDGQIFWALGSARLVRYRDRLCALIAVVDITEMKRLTQDLERTQQELREALAVKQKLQEAAERDSRAKSTLLVNLSHEIRTPLNGLMGMAQMLAEETVEPSLKTLAESIHKAALALHEVATEIIEHSELESTRAPSGISTFDPIQMICEAVREVGPLLADKPVELATLCSCDVPSRVRLDGARFSQAFAHVLNNAAKFTERGSVVVRCDYGLDCLTVSVADTGIGIPSDRLDEVFHEFLQVDGSSTRRYGGIGLGLSIAKKAVESLGGEIYASSEEGAGSTFTLVVPAPPAAPPRMPARNADRRTACVISDSDAMAQMLEAVCRFRGYEPWRLALGDWDGQTGPSDELILLDVPNDREAARSALERLRALPEAAQNGAICLMHSAAWPEGCSEAELASVRFLTKPTDPLALCEALNCCETWNTSLVEEPMEDSGAFAEWESPEAQVVHLPLVDDFERDWSGFDDEFIRRVAALLEETSETCLEGMALGIEREDPVLVSANAYCLHGSALNAGATAAAKLCRRIFELAHHNDFAGAASLLPRVRDEVADFQVTIDRQLSRKEA